MPSIEVTTPPSPPAQSTSRADTPTRTNTLVIAQLPAAFFHPPVMHALRDHFETYGAVHTWAPIRAFSRIILVYFEEEDAEEAKMHCDGLVIDATHESAQFTLRVFRGTHTTLTPSTPPTGPNMKYLQPPAIEKNFLISPPGSPPVGWEPVKEDPPNATPLAEDLISALRKLELARRTPGGLEVLLDPEDGAGIGVYVEDCDEPWANGEDDEEGQVDWAYGADNPSRQWKPVPTALPPVPIRS
ncbi:Calcipressin [Auriscalpium vulgare]|uniref:Calcipressin n=1 Tax=Auriscalpium vulgare TaxID=40419 RepID=A0ACB8RSE1_9AGAM|nr:Calcipressin [Auriscalpium vulgare]